jgi:hypothetical protein
MTDEKSNITCFCCVKKQKECQEIIDKINHSIEGHDLDLVIPCMSSIILNEITVIGNKPRAKIYLNSVIALLRRWFRQMPQEEFW